MAITTTEQTSIIKLVLGMFNAAPGATNLSSIVAHYEANGKDLSNLADALASNAAFTDQFAGLVTVSGIANKMAANFGLTTGTAYTNAVAYFEQEITAGKTNQSIMKAAVDYLSGSTVDAVYADVVTTLTNKYTVALDYSVTKQLSAATVAELQAVVASVDATAASVTAALAVNTTGTTYTLTTGADTLTGTAGNDTFIGLSAATVSAATDTLTVTDTIDGGAGTDTLKITTTANNTNITDAATISNVEVIELRATAGTASLDASTISGLTSYVTNASAGVSTVTNLASGATATIKGNGVLVTGAANIGYAAAATAATLNIEGGTIATSGAIAITGTGLTSATINSTGATNTTGTVTINGTNATALTINAASSLNTGTITDTDGTIATVTATGAGTLVTLGTLTAAVKTLDASAMTAGGVSATLDAAITSFKGGAGADTVTTVGTTATTAGMIDGAAGTDTLVLAADMTTLIGVEYVNFETVRLAAGGTHVATDLAGTTAFELQSGANSITAMTATQAAAVTARADITTGAFALADSSGTSDVLSLTLGTGKLATEATDTGALTLNGFETLNLKANGGPTAVTAVQVSTIASLTSDKLTTVNLTGTAFTITNAATTKASTINASALTGEGTTTGSLGLAIGSTTFKAGQTVTGSDFVDTVIIAAGTEGAILNLGAGNDVITVDVASLVADGTTDGTYNGGTGTADTLTISDGTTATLTDNHFTNVSNMDKITFSGTSSTSLTVGAAFNAAFSSGATITTGNLADNSIITVNAGLSTVDTTILVSDNDLVGTVNSEDITLTTGSGADTVTFASTGWLGAAGDAATIAIDTGAGNDTISVTHGALLVQTTSQAVTVDAGTGADTITKVGTNKTNAAATTIFTIAEGDSLITANDKITGFDISDGTNFSDTLNFATAAVGTLGTSTDSGTILSHSITNGVVTFDDASVFATTLVINSTNLTDALTYLNTNANANGVYAFTYDSTSNGVADATMVFHNGAATDSLVQLVGVTAADAIVIGANAAGANDIHVA